MSIVDKIRHLEKDRKYIEGIEVHDHPIPIVDVLLKKEFTSLEQFQDYLRKRNIAVHRYDTFVIRDTYVLQGNGIFAQFYKR